MRARRKDIILLFGRRDGDVRRVDSLQERSGRSYFQGLEKALVDLRVATISNLTKRRAQLAFVNIEGIVMDVSHGMSSRRESHGGLEG